MAQSWYYKKQAEIQLKVRLLARLEVVILSI